MHTHPLSIEWNNPNHKYFYVSEWNVNQKIPYNLTLELIWEGNEIFSFSCKYFIAITGEKLFEENINDALNEKILINIRKFDVFWTKISYQSEGWFLFFTLLVWNLILKLLDARHFP